MFLTTHFTIHSMPSLTPSLKAQKSQLKNLKIPLFPSRRVNTEIQEIKKTAMPKVAVFTSLIRLTDGFKDGAQFITDGEH